MEKGKFLFKNNLLSSLHTSLMSQVSKNTASTHKTLSLRRDLQAIMDTKFTVSPGRGKYKFVWVGYKGGQSQLRIISAGTDGELPITYVNPENTSVMVKLIDGHPLLAVMQHLEKKVMAVYAKHGQQYACNPAVKVPEESHHAHTIRLKTGYTTLTHGSVPLTQGAVLDRYNVSVSKLNFHKGHFHFALVLVGCRAVPPPSPGANASADHMSSDDVFAQLEEEANAESSE